MPQRQREHRHQVEQHERRQRRRACRAPARRGCSRSTVEHRHLARARARSSAPLEHRRLGDRQPHASPTSTSTALARNGMRQPQAKNCVVARASADSSRKMPRRTEEADRRAELREHAVPGALAGRRVLGRQQHRPAPLAAQPQALAEAAQREQQRRRQADRWRRSAAARSPPSTRPSSAAPRPASPCGRCGRRSGRTAPSRPAARRTRCAKVASDCSVADAGSRRREEQLAGTPAPRRWRRCRSRRTRSWCRSGWRTGPGGACSPREDGERPWGGSRARLSGRVNPTVHWNRGGDQPELPSRCAGLHRISERLASPLKRAEGQDAGVAVLARNGSTSARTGSIRAKLSE